MSEWQADTHMVILAQYILWFICQKTYNADKVYITKVDYSVFLIFLFLQSNDFIDVHHPASHWVLCDCKTAHCISSYQSRVLGFGKN